jgi:hypothetical protein
MPLALLAFHRLVEEITARRVALAGLAYGALWMTHNVTGLAFTPILAAYVLYRLLAEPGSAKAKLGRAAAALGGALLGLGISAALLLPNLFERVYINQEQWVRASYDYALHFVYPFQLLSPFWGYGAAGPGPVDGMSFQLGAVPLILSVVATLRAFYRPKERSLVFFFSSATVLLIFLMLPVSRPLWDLLPIAALVQFPWRLLALAAVTMAILSGLAISRPRKSAESSGEDFEGTGQRTQLDPRVLVLALVAVLGSFAYTTPQYTPIPESAEGPLMTIEFELEYTDMRGMTAWTEEFPTDSPLVEQYLTGGPLVTAEALAPGATVEMIRAGGASDELWVRSAEGTPLQFYTYYFPGWRVFVDGQRLPDSDLRPEPPYGLLTIDVPAGEHHVLLRWGDTPLRLLGKVLTLFCLALALFLVAWPSIRRRRRNASP